MDFILHLVASTITTRSRQVGEASRGCEACNALEAVNGIKSDKASLIVYIEGAKPCTAMPARSYLGGTMFHHFATSWEQAARDKTRAAKRLILRSNEWR